jgi:hypothetical protein
LGDLYYYYYFRVESDWLIECLDLRDATAGEIRGFGIEARKNSIALLNGGWKDVWIGEMWFLWRWAVDGRGACLYVWSGLGAISSHHSSFFPFGIIHTALYINRIIHSFQHILSAHGSLI